MENTWYLLPLLPTWGHPRYVLRSHLRSMYLLRRISYSFISILSCLTTPKNRAVPDRRQQAPNRPQGDAGSRAACYRASCARRMCVWGTAGDTELGDYVREGPKTDGQRRFLPQERQIGQTERPCLKEKYGGEHRQRTPLCQAIMVHQQRTSCAYPTVALSLSTLT